MKHFPFHCHGERGISPADRKRQEEAVAAFHERKRIKARNRRLCILAVVCISIALPFMLFYLGIKQ